MSFPYRIIDLTHPLSSHVPSYDGTCGFSQILDSDYSSSENVSFRIQHLQLHSGIGTHIDAPAHCVRGALFVDDIPINQLISPCKVINVSEKANADFILSACHVSEWEENHGSICDGDFILIRTGWDTFFGDADRYRNNLRFPTISEEVASVLIEKNISGIGVDTLSPDLPSNNFPVHRIMLGANKYIVENIARADLLPPTGSLIFVVPMKISCATEAPVRLFGMIKK